MTDLSPRETAARALHPRAFDPKAQPPINFGQTWDEARAEAITEALEDADRVLAAVAAHDGLADELRRHKPVAMGAFERRWLECSGCDETARDHEGFAAHLADVVRAWMTGELDTQGRALVPPATSTQPCEA